ncbi:hypothetical protein C2W59_01326 [Bacillus pumilus]|uniref:hypothetical protein n=1 Tax=Bacillus pumilus TaxID=1408 RepID=UPI000DC3A53E|nr:hypothetical protein [Bacillus pumilus]RAP19083.1 hypothetical protein C2W59_01326 [Bacillus pumilus]
MKSKTDAANTFPSMRIEEIDHILLNDLDAIKMEKEDERIKFILQDPYCPDKSDIHSLYVIYKKSILNLLEGRIRSIHSHEFMTAKKKDRTIFIEDIEYVLEMATVVVLASENNGILTNYFYSGVGERLDCIFNLCLGYSSDLQKKENKVSLQRYMNDIKIVEEMGLLEKF